MAHNIAEENGTAMMAYTGDTPWHGLGQKVSNKMSPKEMLEKANLNWEVESVPVYLMNGMEIPGKKAIKRKDNDKVFDITSNRFNIVQNEECFDFFAKFVKEGKMNMETAGGLDDGQRIWALAKMKDASFGLPGDDQVDSYLLLANQHKAGRALTIMYTPIRVVCHNTLTYALKEGKRRGGDAFHMPRSRKFDGEVKAQVELALGLATEQREEFQEAAKFLCKKKARDMEVDQYFADLFQPTLDVSASDEYNRAVSRLRVAYTEQPGFQMSKGTWWTAFNAVTYFIDHHANKTAVSNNQNNRLRNSWFGTMAAKKHAALGKALEYAKRA